MSDARVSRVTGALVEAEPIAGVFVHELARVGRKGLLGEVIRVEGERATLQVYEETAGLELGEPIEPLGRGLTAQLGPGLLGTILDGIGRPLARLAEMSGDFIAPGVVASTLDPVRRFSFVPSLEAGCRVAQGDVLGRIEERTGMMLPVVVPPGVAGTIAELVPGEFNVVDVIGKLEDGAPLRLAHEWPVRRPRPVSRRLPPDRPLLTGQRIFDFLFPVAEGGSVSVPGGFGTGKTVIEQSLAKYVDADIVIFVGCGERGNEIADVLEELPRLSDPRTGGSLLDRTIMVVNTSNMPVAAREASIYLGMTLGEYYRDLGLRVAVMADSLSRWAEALREIGSRLQEMPGEEGYPTYLANRLSKVYERTGRVMCLGTPEREGSLTFIGAISPPGGDFSEPVTQAALRVVGNLWALDPALAHQRQFPAVDWEASFSLYAELLMPWFAREGGSDWPRIRGETLSVLHRERETREIASLVGAEALQDRDRLVLETGRLVREVVIGQNAFHPHDASSSVEKTHRLASLVLRFFHEAEGAVESGVPFDRLRRERVWEGLVSLRTAAPEDSEALAEAVRTAIDDMGADR
ncbi:MAG TPA: V-type ATP synthase subunit A [Vicinamibacteria bacterium]|nr:V-type ATP synthase subunit A [Vicinamibacteria bacterium]